MLKFHSIGPEDINKVGCFGGLIHNFNGVLIFFCEVLN